MTKSAPVHIYCRVSSSGQEDGYGLEVQEAACRRWCLDRELSVVDVWHEVWSGKDRHRPQLDALIESLDRGDLVLSYDLDRLSRGGQVDTAIIIDRIESAGAAIAFVATDFEQSETGALLRNVRAFASALEREKIVERTQAGMRARVASGKPLVGARPPYGYQWNRDKSRLLLDPETAPIVRSMFDWALEGVSLRGIISLLQRRGIPSPSGKPYWAPSVLRDLLRRTVYTGTVTAYQTRQVRLSNGSHQRSKREPEERIALAGVAPAIITDDEHKAVLARLDSNQASATRNNKDPEATLLRAGFIYCGHCGNRLTVARSTKSGASYRCDWGTAARHNCPRPTILAHMIDPVVWDVVAKILKDPETIAQEVARARDDGSLARELATLDRMLAQITDKQGRIAKRVASIDDEDVAAPLMAELHDLSRQKKAIEAERGDLKHRMADAEADAAQLRTMTEWCQSVASNIDALTYAERRIALSGLGVSVRVWKPNTLNEQGQPNPRWQIDLAPAFASSPAHLVLGTACAAASSAE